MATHRIETEMLAAAGRLLLEYNESTGQIERTLATTARALTNESLDIAVMYGGVVVSLGDDGPLVKPVRELRYNAALQARVHSILRRVRDGELGVSAATAELARAEADTPKHSRWLAIAVLGVAASALAALLGADVGAVTRRRHFYGSGALRTSGAGSAPRRLVGPAVHRRFHRSSFGRNRHSTFVDANSRAGFDRSLPNARPRATPDQRPARSDR